MLGSSIRSGTKIGPFEILSENYYCSFVGSPVIPRRATGRPSKGENVGMRSH
jgi:hypothetical protein